MKLPSFESCSSKISSTDRSLPKPSLNDLKKEFKFTYIFISHDLSVVKFMSDRMVVMQKGKIEEIGDADEIYNNPKTEYTKKLINSVPKGTLEDIKASISKKESKILSL